MVGVLTLESEALCFYLIIILWYPRIIDEFLLNASLMD